MASTLTEVQTYIISKNPKDDKYDKTTKNKLVKINSSLVAYAEDLKLNFHPDDRESAKITKIVLSNGMALYIKNGVF